MNTFLFDKIIFGPVRSRRLGVSLGINLLPIVKKYCNLDCIYCECGWSHLHDVHKHDIPSRETVAKDLIKVLTDMKALATPPDVITFAGNGEPTMHPEFEGIVDDTVTIRNEIFPNCKIALLCNSTLIHKPAIIRAMQKLDTNILKLDTAIEETFIRLNKPDPAIKLDKIIKSLIEYPGPAIIQTLFIKGDSIDNTTDHELQALINAYKQINPDSIMVYSFERNTADSSLIKVPPDELNGIAAKLREEGFTVEVS
jgi:wyosine [tRNA(Phe)-imidazoG37] synthetase (radical SAM superfamily)